MRLIHITRQFWTKNSVNCRPRPSAFSATVGPCHSKGFLPVGLVSSCANNSWHQYVEDPHIQQREYTSASRGLFPCTLSWSMGVSPTGSRGFAKGKDKKKGEKGKKNVKLNEAELSEIVAVETLKSQLQKPVDKLKEEFMRNLSLRSTTGSIETLPITLDGKDYILQELAQVVRKDPKTVIVNMATFPQAIPAAIQAIQKSGMNLNPQQDSTTLFIPIPKVTKEHRENLSKNAKVLFIKCRDSIKDVQNKFIKNIKQGDHVSKDAAHNAQEQITSLADQYIATAQSILDGKQAELLRIS